MSPPDWPANESRPTQINKKLNRVVVYTGDDTRALYENNVCLNPEADPQEAHRFLHGHFDKGDAAEPTLDEMLEAIAAKLADDCEKHMLACTENEGYLRDMYQRSQEKGMMVKLPWR